MPGRGGAASLADAQLVIAREYGFASWPKLKRHVESLAAPPAEERVDIEPFKAAVESRDAEGVRRVLREQPAVRRKIDAPVFGMDAPAVVHARHDRAVVDALLDAGADINVRGQFWGRAISVLDDVTPDLAAYYVSRGASPQLGEFASAVKSGDVAAARRLLEQHPSLRHHVNRPLFHFGQRPVGAARDNLPMLDLLLEHGADINLKSDWWAGGFGVLDGVDPARADALIGRGAVVDIHAAAHLGRMDRVKELVTQDPGLVHAKGGDGKRPLHDASTKEIIDFLLDHGAEIDARCVDHVSTAAQWAVRNEWKCRHLLERGATPDIFMAAALGGRGAGAGDDRGGPGVPERAGRRAGVSAGAGGGGGEHLPMGAAGQDAAGGGGEAGAERSARAPDRPYVHRASTRARVRRRGRTTRTGDPGVAAGAAEGTDRPAPGRACRRGVGAQRRSRTAHARPGLPGGRNRRRRRGPRSTARPSAATSPS